MYDSSCTKQGTHHYLARAGEGATVWLIEKPTPTLHRCAEVESLVCDSTFGTINIPQGVFTFVHNLPE